MAGPWTYPFDLPTLVGSDASFEMALGFEATGRTSNTATAEFATALGFECTGVANRMSAGSFETTLGFDAIGTASVPNFLGPWTYPFDLPTLPEGGASFDFGLGFDATGTPWSVLADGVSATTYDDDSVFGGVTYRYRVIDSLGNVLTSGDVLFNPYGPASFALGLSSEVTGRKGARDAATFALGMGFDASGQATTGAGGHCEYDFALGFSATGRKQTRSAADFQTIVTFETTGVGREAASSAAQFDFAMGFECEGISNVMPQGIGSFDILLGFDTLGTKNADDSADFRYGLGFNTATITRPVVGPRLVGRTRSIRLIGTTRRRS